MARPAQPEEVTKLFRTMMENIQGVPACGSSDCMLGVRVPIDVKPDENGNVAPGRGGMSVTPNDPSRLPYHLRPIALGGISALPLFWIARMSIAGDLWYRPDARKPSRHGLVEPSRTMSLSALQNALCSTAALWQEWQQ